MLQWSDEDRRPLSSAAAGRAGAASVRAATCPATQLLGCASPPWSGRAPDVLIPFPQWPHCMAASFSFFPLDADELAAPAKFVPSLPFQATRAHQQLRQEHSNRLHPLAQALVARSSNPSRSSPIPAETTAVDISPWPDLLRASLPPPFAPLKSRWAADPCAPFGWCFACLWRSVLVRPRWPPTVPVAMGARLRESECYGGPEVRSGAENATNESRESEVARLARSRHWFGRPELKDEADSGGPLSATPWVEKKARASRAWAKCERAGLRAEFLGRSRHNAFSLLPFVQNLIYLWICIENVVQIQKQWKFLYKFYAWSRT